MVLPFSSTTLVPFERFAPCSEILLSLSLGLLLFSNSLVVVEGFAPCSEIAFERFSPCSQIRSSLSSGLLLLLKMSSRLRAVSALFLPRCSQFL